MAPEYLYLCSLANLTEEPASMHSTYQKHSIAPARASTVYKSIGFALSIFEPTEHRGG